MRPNKNNFPSKKVLEVLGKIEKTDEERADGSGLETEG
jgi:hypothetical protein